MAPEFATWRLVDLPGTRIRHWLSGRADFRLVLDLLDEVGENYYLVGGVVREFLRGGSVTDCGDLDLLVPWESGAVLPRLKNLPPAGETRFGNPRFALPGGAYLDVFPPASSLARVASADEAIPFLDFTVNAFAFDPVAGTVLCPRSALSDLENGLLRPLAPAWALAVAAEKVHLLGRLVALHRRLGFTLADVRCVRDAVAATRVAREVDVSGYGLRSVSELVTAVEGILAR